MYFPVPRHFYTLWRSYWCWLSLSSHCCCCKSSFLGWQIVHLQAFPCLGYRTVRNAMSCHTMPLRIFMSAMVGLLSALLLIWNRLVSLFSHFSLDIIIIAFSWLLRCEAQITSLMRRKCRYVNHFTWFNKCGAAQAHTHTNRQTRVRLRSRQPAAPNLCSHWICIRTQWHHK